MSHPLRQEHSCQDAQNATTNGRQGGVQQLVDESFTTSTQMDQSPVLLRICFASWESGGNSTDDYTELLGNFSQLSPPHLSPDRTVSGAPQRLNISNRINPGSQVAFTQHEDCSQYGQHLTFNTAVSATPYNTVVYTLDSAASHQEVSPLHLAQVR